MNNTEELYQELLEGKHSIFHVLNAEEKAKLKKDVSLISYKKGETVFSEGERPVGFVCLMSGKVKIFKEGLGGREQIIRMTKPVSFICYRAVFAQEHHHASGVALEDSQVFLIPKNTMLDLVKSNSELSLNIIHSLSVELGFSYYRTITLTQKHIRGRLAESLLFLKNTYGLEKDEITLKVYLSREDIANLSNMTTSNAIRTLSAFASEHLISIDGRKIKLLDISKLEKISDMG